MRLDTDASFMGESAFTAMIEGIREAAVEAGMIDSAVFDDRVNGLYRNCKTDGVFCYTFFRAVAGKF